MSDETKTVKNLVCKLASIVAEIDHVEKKGRNEFQKYNYVRAADLANAVRRKLSEHKVFLLSDVISRETVQIAAKDGGTWLFENIEVLYTFHDGDSGETLCFKMPGTGADKGDKAVYKAITGSLKYALRNAFLVPDEAADPEADETTDKEAGKLAAAAVAKAKTVAGTAPNNRVVWVKVATVDVEGEPAEKLVLTGYTVELADWMTERFGWKEKAVNGWVLDTEHLDDLKAECQKLNITVLDAPSPTRTSSGAGSSSQVPAGPVIDSYKDVGKFAAVGVGGVEHTCWDEKLKPVLKAAVGKPCELVVTVKTKDGKTYRNIQNIVHIDGRQFDQDLKNFPVQR